MLKYSLGCLLAAATFPIVTASAQQTAPPALPASYTYVERMPVFPGGQEALFRHISEAISYPTAALEQRLEGRVFVQFVVGTSGSVQDVKVSRGVHSLLDAEAIRTVQQLPAFEPGRQVGRAVPVAFTLPITFRLPPDVPGILAERAAGITQAEHKARFPGGPEALRTFVSSQPRPTGYQSPAPASRPPRVFVQFVVDSTGAVKNAEAVQLLAPSEIRRMHQQPTIPPPDAALVAAAVARIGAMPAWEPATKDGRRVAAMHTEPVTFGEAGPALSYADEMPVFPEPDGEGRYTGTQIRYPVAALRSQTQGAVLLYYEVAEDGHMEKLEVIRSVSPEIDAEALRVFGTNFPQYQPGRHQGRPARVFYVVPVTFSIR